MKKLSVVICFLLAVLGVRAQYTQFPFFDENGLVTTIATQPSDSNRIVTVYHRADDIAWSRVVYRVIDMRFKQNYPLHFPLHNDDPDYHNLLNVILEAIPQGLKLYNVPANLKPKYVNKDGQMDTIPYVDVAARFRLDVKVDEEQELDGTEAGDNLHKSCCDPFMVLHYDSATNVFSPFYENFERFNMNQLKYVIQEILFFDKHYSRMYSKILAIAPVYTKPEETSKDGNPYITLQRNMLCWIVFDDLRPYMAKHYILDVNEQASNGSKRQTFDDFFARQLYTSYLLGDDNIFGRQIVATNNMYHYGKLFDNQTEEDVKKEQKRIETELLNFEQDLWEY